MTVFYGARSGERVGYAIVDGHELPVSGGQTVTRGGISYRLLSRASARLVTWLRHGHTCVIAGRGVSDVTLLRLAATGAER